MDVPTNPQKSALNIVKGVGTLTHYSAEALECP